MSKAGSRICKVLNVNQGLEGMMEEYENLSTDVSTLCRVFPSEFSPLMAQNRRIKMAVICAENDGMTGSHFPGQPDSSDHNENLARENTEYT